jgi:hypothetical protein
MDVGLLMGAIIMIAGTIAAFGLGWLANHFEDA